MANHIDLLKYKKNTTKKFSDGGQATASDGGGEATGGGGAASAGGLRETNSVLREWSVMFLVLFEVLVFSAEPDEGKHYNIKAYTNKDDPPEEVWREEWHQCYGERYKNDKKEGPVDGICVKVLFLHHGRLHMLRSLTKSCFMLPIETEKLLTELVEAEMNKRQILGHICYHILAAGLNGYMATITNLKSPSNKWRCGAAPITAMMSVKHDGHGYRAMTVGKPFVHPATVVDLRGKVARSENTLPLMKDLWL
ncbi:pyrophosphate--fructose 6-phosphate 1-phosphotransferase subunit alpha [Tanacetum coccineum]